MWRTYVETIQGKLLSYSSAHLFGIPHWFCHSSINSRAVRSMYLGKQIATVNHGM